MGFGARRVALNTLPVSPGASGFISLNLSFPLCLMGLMILGDSWDYSKR